MNNDNLEIGMHAPLLDAIPELCKENLGLFNAPAHDLGQQIEPPALSALGNMQQIPATQLLHMGIRRPTINRDLVQILVHINEARIAHIHNQIPNFIEALSESAAGLVENIAPLREHVVGLERAVVALELDRHFQLVQVAAWLEVVVYLCVEIGPRVDGAVQGADVDEVEARRVGPGEGYVVDFEFAVGWREGGLDGREVDARDFGGGVLWVGGFSKDSRYMRG